MTVMSQPMSVLTSHASQDWYTPPDIIELVRSVLGVIDLDPASDALPQTWIKANRFYSKPQDGVFESWDASTVWLNPPYGKDSKCNRSNQQLWSALMASKYEGGVFKQGILLINSTHGYKWYEDLWTRYPVCLARERIRFIKPDGTQGGQAKRGQTFVYFGKDSRRFAEIFSGIGRIIVPS